ncbi:MAG TPA: protein-methionine-sulfoxide reductase catalytic subunit MsrP [Gammaproteobacteria bacterium]|nr:protein-methionine-sulfoxide reductase catalytic subunit MsrP [Gammaproteobacteria bacterium]
MIRIPRRWEIPESEVTPEPLYRRRREFIKSAGVFGGALLLNPLAAAQASLKIGAYEKGVVTLDEEPTQEEDATSYNNFYEFGTGKEDPKRNSKRFKTDDWTLEVGGHCEKPGTLGLEDLVRPHPIEERIYRLRCVEAWSMVIPWLGVPLGSVLAAFQPTSKAKYVAFKTLHDPVRMPGQQRAVLYWPYREGLTIAEAMHPLTILAVGMYGKTIPNQNGAPIRLVVPWKYGFKSIKSIVSIEFTEEQPQTSWNMAAPQEYGFYSNVNPEVDHPRWSQKRERRIGDIFKRDTLMFNGYGDEVASLYDDLDLAVNF